MRNFGKIAACSLAAVGVLALSGCSGSVNIETSKDPKPASSPASPEASGEVLGGDPSTWGPAEGLGADPSTWAPQEITYKPGTHADTVLAVQAWAIFSNLPTGHTLKSTNPSVVTVSQPAEGSNAGFQGIGIGFANVAVLDPAGSAVALYPVTVTKSGAASDAPQGPDGKITMAALANMTMNVGDTAYWEDLPVKNGYSVLSSDMLVADETLPSNGKIAFKAIGVGHAMVEVLDADGNTVATSHVEVK